jgi:hypothetical protein
MKKFSWLLIALLVFAPFALAPLALAQNETELTVPVGGGILPGSATEAGTDFKSAIIFSKVIPFVIRFGTGLAMVLAVLAIVLGGYQYLTAYGDEEKHEKAKKIIMYAGVGLVAAMMAYGLVTLVTSFRFGLPSAVIPSAYADVAADRSSFVDALEQRQRNAQDAFDALEKRVDKMEGSDPKKKLVTDCPGDDEKAKAGYLCEADDAVTAFLDLEPDASLVEIKEGETVVGYEATPAFNDAEAAALKSIADVNVTLITPAVPGNVPTGDLVDDFIPAAIRLLFRFAWIAVLISFLYSGTLMVMTFDNEERTTKAKQMLYYSLLGFAFVTLAFALVKAVTNIDFFGFV